MAQLKITDRLYRHLNQFINCKEADFTAILSYFQLQSFEKKDILMEAGKTCDRHFFVLQGCLHMYYINDKGSEKTVKLAIKNWWISDYQALYHRQKTAFYIQAVENTQVLLIDHKSQEKLIEAFPCMNAYFRQVYQIAYGATIMRIKFLYEYSKEEMFFRFNEQFPEFVQRVPQYLLATYLGLTPEYLSEIRKKRRS